MRLLRLFVILALTSISINGFSQRSKADTKASAFKSFEIGENDFILNGKPTIIRCGEMHFARIPREYWTHRLKMVKAMGLNAVCAYLFWNFHEPEPGKFNWEGIADAAEFCRLAQKEGLMVILRPGPYACAEWEFGGFPWWLLKKKDIALRTQDPYYMERCKIYLKEVGRVLAPLQITKGGPIVMVQVENEYGSYGDDKVYIGRVRDNLKESGFNVPLFTCDGPSQLTADVRDDIFSVVNFGGGPEGAFKKLRDIRKKGPLMCGEYYPAWFDSWGDPHHTKQPESVVKDLSYMMDHNASFSIYMVHGGTTFSIWSGANCPPFLPQTSSYDYDAPVSEAGWDTPKFHILRNMFSKYLAGKETLPDVPKRNPVITTPEFKLSEIAPVFDNLGTPIYDLKPRNFEEYNLGYGSIVYRTQLPASGEGKLSIKELHDYAVVLIDGKKVATLDRRLNQGVCKIPAHNKPATLEIYVEAMGRVNYGEALHDRKGITEKVEFLSESASFEPLNWEIFTIPAGDNLVPQNLKYKQDTTSLPAYYRGSFTLSKTGDTFFDVSTWGKGLVWLNGHCLGRFWNIGPTQTMYVPGPWLKKGLNEVVVLDINGPKQNTIKGLTLPVLDKLNNKSAQFKNRKPNQKLDLKDTKPVISGLFQNTADWQTVKFASTEGRYFCLEALDNFKDDEYTTCAELYLMDEKGKDIPRDAWKIVYADSEEVSSGDGKADNVFDLQSTSFWHTQWQDKSPKHPHQIVIDLGVVKNISGVRYLSRQDNQTGRIKDYNIYLSKMLFKGL
jgi:beta-galactosidase